MAVVGLVLAGCGARSEDEGPTSTGVQALGAGDYRVLDSGVRCFRAPCPSMEARAVEGAARGSFSAFQFPAGFTDAEQQRLLGEVMGGDGATVRGHLDASAEGGLFVLEAVVAW